MSARIKYTVAIVAALLLALMTVLATQAFANYSTKGTPHSSYADRPPTVTLKKGPTLLETATWGTGYSWNFYRGSLGYPWQQSGFYNDSQYVWPHRMPLVRKGDHLTVRVWKPEKPAKFRMVAYSKVTMDDKEFRPIGGTESKLHRSDFAAIRRGGKVRGWKTTFTVPTPHRSYWVVTEAKWNRYGKTSWGEAEYLLRFKAR